MVWVAGRSGLVAGRSNHLAGVLGPLDGEDRVDEVAKPPDQLTQ